MPVLKRASKAPTEAERVQSVERWIKLRAFSLARRARLSPEATQDLIAEGRLAALVAARRFDESRGFKFMTLAGVAIGHAMALWVRKYGRTVNGPKIGRREGAEIDPSTHRGAQDGWRWKGTDDVRLDATIQTEDGAPLELMDLIESHDPGPEELAMQRERRRKARAAMAVLSQRDRFILRRRSQGGTLEAIGREVEAKNYKRHPLTRERVRQVERAAIEKVRQELKYLFPQRF